MCRRYPSVDEQTVRNFIRLCASRNGSTSGGGIGVWQVDGVWCDKYSLTSKVADVSGAQTRSACK
jgi:hypothetical protein